METNNSIVLPNNVRVQFYPEKVSLERMMDLAKTDDFLKETSTIDKIGCFPPMQLLVYDEIMALGLCGPDGTCMGVRDYTEKTLIDWVDMALSLRGHPIRVVEKTTQKGEMFKRLKPRLDLDWIEYEPNTQVVREIAGALCPAQKFFKEAPACKELYSLMEYGGNVEVVHMKIHEDYEINERGIKRLVGIQSHGSGEKEFFREPIEQVETMLKDLHPGALVIREPLIYCSHGCSGKPWSCLAHQFEKAYAKKVGFEGTPNFAGPTQSEEPSDEGLIR